jgi:hypothetical protein
LGVSTTVGNFIFSLTIQSTKRRPMIKNILFAVTLLITSGALNSVKAQKHKQGTKTTAKSDVKFLDNITVTPASTTISTDPKAAFATSQFTITQPLSNFDSSMEIESANKLQFKYALLLDQEVEQVKNIMLFKLVDEWLGTRYKLGGSTKDGIDCSAFTQMMFTALYGVNLPRTAREQYVAAKKISLTELKEGDLIFFNTIGGVSHVGMYLQNNKFVHASSNGVTISDLYEEYWIKHFIAAGRIDQTQQATVSVTKP